MVKMTNTTKLSDVEIIRLMNNLYEIYEAIPSVRTSYANIQDVFYRLDENKKQNYEICLIFLKMSPGCFDLIPDINKTVEMHLLMFEIHKIFKPMMDNKKNEIFCTELISKCKLLLCYVEWDMIYRYSLFVKKYIKYVGRDIFNLPEYEIMKWNEDYCKTYKRESAIFIRMSKWPFNIGIEYKYSDIINIIKSILFILN